MRTATTPMEPTADWLCQFMTPSLLKAPAYHIDRIVVPLKLDQNEFPLDWPAQWKEKLLLEAAKKAWNRYPEPYATNLETLLAQSLGLKPQNILVGPGSNLHISLLLSTLCRQRKGPLIAAQPSFALYETHARYEGIPYKVWPLVDFEYDLKALPPLTPGAVVIFASPNNPVGNILPFKTLADLLQKNPDVFFIADEAYYEFVDETYLPLLAEHSNLVIIRTFSKAKALAGLRLGYTIASTALIHELRKVQVPYLITPLVSSIAESFLTDPKVQDYLRDYLHTLQSERQQLSEGIQALNICQVVPSHGNFLLMKFADSQRSEKVYQHLIRCGILLRNVSKGPGLACCLRLTLGTSTENKALLDALGQSPI